MLKLSTTLLRNLPPVDRHPAIVSHQVKLMVEWHLDVGGNVKAQEQCLPDFLGLQ